MALPLAMYRVQPWTEARVKSDFPNLAVRVDDGLCFSSQTWGAVLDGRELFTCRVADGKTIRVPRDVMMPVYETSASNKNFLGTMPIPTMYVTTFGKVPLWLALVNGAHSLEQFREDIIAYKPNIKASWPVSFYQLHLNDLLPPNSD